MAVKKQVILPAYLIHIKYRKMAAPGMCLEHGLAGREDFVRNQGWDLEGQRELEQADSGYTPQVGTLSDYQAGYREGFRNAYREGFYTARDAQ